MLIRRAFSLLSVSNLAIALVVSGCGFDGPTDPGALSPTSARASHGTYSSPHFLTADPVAPSMANPVIAFWAHKGLDTRVNMYYHALPGHNDSTTFMQFRVRDKSLESRPDGSSFATGDSVLITVTLVDPAQLKLDFQPSGLRFSAHDQAELRLNFSQTLHDLNGDGVVDHKDVEIQRTFRIWRKESVLDPWLPLSSIVLNGSMTIDAKLDGFTGYAAAY